jgi:hypothetical protein
MCPPLFLVYCLLLLFSFHFLSSIFCACSYGFCHHPAYLNLVWTKRLCSVIFHFCVVVVAAVVLALTQR